jgi:hypothetical protein
MRGWWVQRVCGLFKDDLWLYKWVIQIVDFLRNNKNDREIRCPVQQKSDLSDLF